MTQQNDNRVKMELQDLRGRWDAAITRKQNNRRTVSDWIRNCLVPAFRELERGLRDSQICEHCRYEPPENVNKDIFDETLAFEYKGNKKTTARYTVHLEVSSEGVTGQTLFNNGEPPQSSTKPILDWGQEDIVEDFLRCCEDWNPVK
jgi:hypothetical protein